MFQKSKEISIEIENLTKKQSEIQNELNKILSNLPNLPHEDVPIGKDESSNKVVNTVGSIRISILK